MARNRLQTSGVQQSYADPSAPSPAAYQPAAENPYAQAQYPPVAQPQQGYAQQQFAPPTQYGQQDAYAMGGNGAGNVAAGGDFWAELSATNAMLSELEQRIQAVRQAHQQSLSSTDPNAIAYADQLSKDAQSSREQCKAAIKQLFKMIKGNKAAKAQAEAAKQRFVAALNEHNSIEKEYRQKTRDRAERQFRIVKPDATPEEVKEVIDADNPQVFAQALLNTNRYGAARGAYREVQERHAEIQKIEKTMTELAQMFNEMSMLVEQQDEAIVNVENQTAGVDQDINKGLEQTVRAVESARKARRKKIICLVIVLIIIVILALVLGIYFGTKNN